MFHVHYRTSVTMKLAGKKKRKKKPYYILEIQAQQRVNKSKVGRSRKKAQLLFWTARSFFLEQDCVLTLVSYDKKNQVILTRTDLIIRNHYLSSYQNFLENTQALNAAINVYTSQQYSIKRLKRRSILSAMANLPIMMFSYLQIVFSKWESWLKLTKERRLFGKMVKIVLLLPNRNSLQ